MTAFRLSAPSPRSIQRYLDLRTRYTVPLWLGETGENSSRWYAWCVRLMDEHDIGWCFWPWKRMGGGCVESVDEPAAWQRTAVALGDPARRADLPRADAVAGLRALADAGRLDRCREDTATVRALRGDYDQVDRMPGTLRAADYLRSSVRDPGNLDGAYRPGAARPDADGDRPGVRRLPACAAG